MVEEDWTSSDEGMSVGVVGEEVSRPQSLVLVHTRYYQVVQLLVGGGGTCSSFYSLPRHSCNH